MAAVLFDSKCDCLALGHLGLEYMYFRLGRFKHYSRRDSSPIDRKVCIWHNLPGLTGRMRSDVRFRLLER